MSHYICTQDLDQGNNKLEVIVSVGFCPFSRAKQNEMRSYDIGKIKIPMPKGFARNDRCRYSVTSSSRSSTRPSLRHFSTSLHRPSPPSHRRTSVLPSSRPTGNDPRRSTILPHRSTVLPRVPVEVKWSDEATDTSETSSRSASSRIYFAPASLTETYSPDSLIPIKSATLRPTKSSECIEIKSVFPESSSEYNTSFPRKSCEIKPLPTRKTAVPKAFFQKAPSFVNPFFSGGTSKTMPPLQTKLENKTQKQSTPVEKFQETKPSVVKTSSSVRFGEHPLWYDDLDDDLDEDLEEEEYENTPRGRRRRWKSAEEALDRQRTRTV